MVTTKPKPDVTASDTDAVAHIVSDNYEPDRSKEQETPVWCYGLPGMLITVLVMVAILVGSTIALFVLFLIQHVSTLW